MKIKRWRHTQIFDKMIEADDGKYVIYEDFIKVKNKRFYTLSSILIGIFVCTMALIGCVVTAYQILMFLFP